MHCGRGSNYTISCMVIWWLVAVFMVKTGILIVRSVGIN
jgi:hypothetical protein